MDIRDVPYIDVVDIYTKGGTHLGSMATMPTTEDIVTGNIVWKEGRQPSKDVVMPEPGGYEYSWEYRHTNPEPEWPDCKIGGCQNKSCRRLNSEYCHPHTILRELKPIWESS
jgi:hypothetical protein